MQNVFLIHEIYMLGYDANWISLFAQNISRASNPTYKCYYFLTPLDKKRRISGVANNFFVSAIRRTPQLFFFRTASSAKVLSRVNACFALLTACSRSPWMPSGYTATPKHLILDILLPGNQSYLCT
jgi:hypothetical protein